jgi:hypothetical protein
MTPRGPDGQSSVAPPEGGRECVTTRIRKEEELSRSQNVRRSQVKPGLAKAGQREREVGSLIEGRIVEPRSNDGRGAGLQVKKS